ncbi:hypothetical protein SCWH03_31540 [Streptomyces pacificus]|uniref:Zn-ribbon domain-containing OB-fold protein n=1 Tax=Streptomyces pacificus TaxID=2705029 RepID=A0A6A0AX48_9ACTN|nr:hypothetical protein SCWH03_31540 [Streptomyces pacificus]
MSGRGGDRDALGRPFAAHSRTASPAPAEGRAPARAVPAPARTDGTAPAGDRAPARAEATGPSAATPDIDDFTRPWWEAAAEGRLLVRRCGACGRAHHYPREFCPYCWSEEVGWEQASGRATLYTWSVVHRNDLLPFRARTPYTAAVVDLAEGPRMMTEIVGCAEEDLRIGMELEAAFREEGGAVVVPVFAPVRAVTAPPRRRG